MGKNKETKSEMGNFIPESTPAAAIAVIKQNTPFIITENGKRLYVGMMLDVMKIGGINKKAVNNQDIGGAIELIKNGNIDAYVTQELNDKNQLLFIPTHNTIDHLVDYGGFRKVDGYEFVKLNDKLEIVEYTGVTATYDDFRSICTGSANITDFVKSSDVIVKGSEDDPTTPHNAITQAVGKAKDIASMVSNAAAPVVDKIAPVASKIVENVKEKFAESSGLKDMVDDTSSKPAEQSVPAVPSETPVTDIQTQAPAEAQPTEEDEQEVVYTETQVLSSVERIFHANNLDLPVSSDPFDQLFTLNNHLIKFDVDSRDTFVNERLNHMAIDANRDLQKLRSDNLKKLREKYFMLMALRVNDIATELDINNQSTKYGNFMSTLNQLRRDNEANLPRTVEARQKIIEDAFNTRLEEVSEIAAKQAKSEFKARYQRQHNDDLNAVEGVVKAEINAEYMASLNDLYSARRNDALTSLDFNITGVLQALTDDYKEMFEQENALYISRANEMREYAKELHMLDAKRLAVEEEHNRITNEVNDARAEASAKIELIKREYETAQAALEARSSATIAQAENENKLIKEQMDARTSTLEQDKEKLQQQLNDAIDRSNNAHEIVKADYEHRLLQAQDDRDSWKQTLDAYKEQHKHNNRLAAILVVAITIAAIAGGFVAGGVYWNRIVSGELSGTQENVEIKVVNPDETVTLDESETTVTVGPDEADEEISDDENAETDESSVTTAVPEDSTITDDESVTSLTTFSSTTSVTTIETVGTETTRD